MCHRREPAALEGFDLDAGTADLPRRGQQVRGAAAVGRSGAILKEAQVLGSRLPAERLRDPEPARRDRAQGGAVQHKVIWNTVMNVAEPVGVVATAHALRRAFAVAFPESHPGAIESLDADESLPDRHHLRCTRAPSASRRRWRLEFPCFRG